MFRNALSQYTKHKHLLKHSSSFQNNLKLENANYVPHTPVLCDSAIEFLDPRPGKTIIDMTFGAGGHSRKILENFKNVKIYALDCDPTFNKYANQLADEYPGQVIPLLGKFSELPFLLKSVSDNRIAADGILFDFGCSSMQFDTAERGFSISKNGPLDMRMNNTNSDQLTAADIIAKIDEHDLAKILRIYGEEKQAKKIARSIIEARSLFKITTTAQLADIVQNSFKDNVHRIDKMQRSSHSATKTFQALRIFVNNELNEINFGMKLAHKILKPNGRLVAITFHSLEDTIVKRHLQGCVTEEGNANPIPLRYSSHEVVEHEDIYENVSKKNWLQLHKHVIVPTENEVKLNPRSRSAKLRAAEKIVD